MAQHSAKGARFQAVTANRLTDGEAVYYAHGSWIDDFSKAQIADGAEAANVLLAEAMPQDYEGYIVEPYLFEVIEATSDDSAYQPISVRETIRAKGPTIRMDLGKQAQN